MLSVCLLCPPCSSDVFKSAMKLGTFAAILVTYMASALLHVSKIMHTFIQSTLHCCWTF